MHLRLSIGPCITVYGKKKKQSEDYFAAVKWHVLDFLSDCSKSNPSLYYKVEWGLILAWFHH